MSAMLQVKSPVRDISISVSTQQIKINIPVEKYTEKEMSAMIVRNKPMKMDVKTFPDKIKFIVLLH